MPLHLKHELILGAVMDTTLCVLNIQMEDREVYTLKNNQHNQSIIVATDTSLWLDSGEYTLAFTKNDSFLLNLKYSGGIYKLYLYRNDSYLMLNKKNRH